MAQYAIRAYLIWSAQNHTTTSFLRNTITVCHRANMYRNTWKCAINMSVNFDSECTINPLLAGLCRDPHTMLSTLPSWIWGRDSKKTGKGHKWKGWTGREERQKGEKRKDGKGNGRRGGTGTRLHTGTANEKVTVNAVITMCQCWML